MADDSPHLVARLRHLATWDNTLAAEAADEIERLGRLIDSYNAKVEDLAAETRRSSALRAIIDRLLDGWEADLTETVPQTWRWRQEGQLDEPADAALHVELWALYFPDNPEFMAAQFGSNPPLEDQP